MKEQVNLQATTTLRTSVVNTAYRHLTYYRTLNHSRTLKIIETKQFNKNFWSHYRRTSKHTDQEEADDFDSQYSLSALFTIRGDPLKRLTEKRLKLKKTAQQKTIHKDK